MLVLCIVFGLCTLVHVVYIQNQFRCIPTLSMKFGSTFCTKIPQRIGFPTFIHFSLLCALESHCTGSDINIGCKTWCEQNIPPEHTITHTTNEDYNLTKTNKARTVWHLDWFVLHRFRKTKEWTIWAPKTYTHSELNSICSYRRCLNLSYLHVRRMFCDRLMAFEGRRVDNIANGMVQCEIGSLWWILLEFVRGFKIHRSID